MGACAARSPVGRHSISLLTRRRNPPLNLTGRLRRAMRGSGSASLWAKAGPRRHCVIGETPRSGPGRDRKIRTPDRGLLGGPLQAPEETRHSHQTQLALAPARPQIAVRPRPKRRCLLGNARRLHPILHPAVEPARRQFGTQQPAMIARPAMGIDLLDRLIIGEDARQQLGQQGRGRGIEFAQLIGQAIALGRDLVVGPRSAHPPRRPSPRPAARATSSPRPGSGRAGTPHPPSDAGLRSRHCSIAPGRARGCGRVRHVHWPKPTPLPSKSVEFTPLLKARGDALIHLHTQHDPWRASGLAGRTGWVSYSTAVSRLPSHMHDPPAKEDRYS